MPWQEVCPMDEKRRFIAALMAADESMSALCEEYGISRKTGYRLWQRFQEEGVAGLAARSRAPHVVPWAITPAVTEALIGLRQAHPSWGPKKLRAKLNEHAPERRWPAPSTIGELLHRAGLSHARRRRPRATPSASLLSVAIGPNDVWCIDFKGWFRTGDGIRCDPLTVSDAFSRYLLCIKVVATPGYARLPQRAGAGIQGVRVAARDALGQWRAVRLGRRGGTESVVGMVGQARDRAGADRAGQAGTERAP